MKIAIDQKVIAFNAEISLVSGTTLKYRILVLCSIVTRQASWLMFQTRKLALAPLDEAIFNFSNDRHVVPQTGRRFPRNMLAQSRREIQITPKWNDVPSIFHDTINTTLCADIIPRLNISRARFIKTEQNSFHLFLPARSSSWPS